MSLVDSFDLSNYETREDLEGLLDRIEYELSTLRGYQRGAEEKLSELPDEPIER